jgi:hypothetical protein
LAELQYDRRLVFLLIEGLFRQDRHQTREGVASSNAQLLAPLRRDAVCWAFG